MGQIMFVNHYKCPICGHEWDDVHDCPCNDRCPGCNKEITPCDSEEVEDANV
jgi:predicted Zn-ribbon and HTH transcriptional regulator